MSPQSFFKMPDIRQHFVVWNVDSSSYYSTAECDDDPTAVFYRAPVFVLTFISSVVN